MSVPAAAAGKVLAGRFCPHRGRREQWVKGSGASQPPPVLAPAPPRSGTPAGMPRMLIKGIRDPCVCRHASPCKDRRQEIGSDLPKHRLFTYHWYPNTLQ